MGAEIKIVLLEDSREDISLISRELTRGGISCELRTTDIKEEFIRLLEEFKPDIILSDHSMPQFNSFEALEIANSRARKIPFILVTGSVSEEFAVQCIKSGADDYILKDRLKRLPDAVRSVLEKTRFENERQVYMSKVLANEERMRELEHLAKLGIWNANLKTDDADWSDGSWRLFGYEPCETTPGFEFFMKHVLADDRDRVAKEIGTVIETGRSRESEFRIFTKDGKLKHLTSRVALMTDQKNPVLVGLIYDITERRKAQSLLLDAYQIARIGAWEYDVITNEMTWSDVAKEIHEVGNDFNLGFKSILSFYETPESRSQIKELVRRGMELGEPWDLEVQITTSTGKMLWVRNIGKAEMVNGKCVRLFGTIQDVNHSKQAELEIEERNKRLMEIAWTQSHEVRGPMARLMGLINLIRSLESESQEHKGLIEKTMTAASELDNVIREIVRKTETMENEHNVKSS